MKSALRSEPFKCLNEFVWKQLESQYNRKMDILLVKVDCNKFYITTRKKLKRIKLKLHVISGEASMIVLYARNHFKLCLTYLLLPYVHWLIDIICVTVLEVQANWLLCWPTATIPNIGRENCMCSHQPHQWTFVQFALELYYWHTPHHIQWC